MQIDNDVITKFSNFLQNKANLEESQKILKTYRNIKICQYNLKDSRCIWSSLLVYKYKKDMNIPEELWKQSRYLILAILKNENTMDIVISEYLKKFSEWQKNELSDISREIGYNYYNLLQIKISIENTKNQETIIQWIPHYNSLIKKIEEYCKSINILESVEKIVLQCEQKKNNIINEIMDYNYWKMIELDILNNNFNLIYTNLVELKTILTDILPKNEKNIYIDEIFDIQYIKQLEQNKLLSRDYFIKIFIFILNFLKEWDSLNFNKIYDTEINKINDLNFNNEKFLVYILQKSLTYAIDLKNRKQLWNLLLNKN